MLSWKGRLNIKALRKKHKKMGHFLGSPKPSKTEDTRVYLYSALPWSSYSQNLRRRELWRHLPRRPIWETMDLKPNCAAKNSWIFDPKFGPKIWPQFWGHDSHVSIIEPLNGVSVTPFLGSKTKPVFRVVKHKILLTKFNLQVQLRPAKFNLWFPPTPSKCPATFAPTAPAMPCNTVEVHRLVLNFWCFLWPQKWGLTTSHFRDWFKALFLRGARSAKQR